MVAITDLSAECVGNIPEDVVPSSSNEYEGTETDDQLGNDYELISTFLDVRAFCHLNLLHADLSVSDHRNGRVSVKTITS